MRLKTDRGLPALPNLFKDVQFAGRGHEAEDLKLLMSRLEHWAHRLFPKMSFDDFIERLEKLGSKKEIMTCVKRIRLDMPVTDSDFVSQTADDIDEPATDDVTAEEAFDAMMRSESEQRSPEADHTTPDRHDSNNHSAQTLSIDQRQRMERSRQLALERRAARLSAAAPSQSTAVAEHSQMDTDTNDALGRLNSESRRATVETTESQRSLSELQSSDDVMHTAEDILDQLDNS